MHWGPEWVSGGVNRRTLGAIDPVSRQPEPEHVRSRSGTRTGERRLDAVQAAL
jgi:hypothetical protein